jgi:hypothetical protein
MRPIIPVSILFAVAIAASASPYPRALPDWNESGDIGVFYPSTMTQEQPSTKVALVAEPRGLGSEIPDWSPRPTFSTTADGKTQATIAVDPGTSLYGTGEVRAPMSKVGLWAFTGGECPVIIQQSSASFSCLLNFRWTRTRRKIWQTVSANFQRMTWSEKLEQLPHCSMAHR